MTPSPPAECEACETERNLRRDPKTGELVSAFINSAILKETHHEVMDEKDELLAERTRELELAKALLREVRDRESLRKVREIMGHDLIHGTVTCWLRDHGAETGPDFHDLEDEARRALEAGERA